jgi:S-adenosylmethionine hydrolase
MNRRSITFFSDTGWGGTYAAICEAVIARVAPAVRLRHIAHDIPAGDTAAGAMRLERMAPLYPEAVHLAVVDPAVQLGRRAIVLRTGRGDMLLGPDNGLLIPAGEVLGGLDGAWVVDPERVRGQARLALEQIALTFNGRDMYAPAAALLAEEPDPVLVATPVDPAELVRLPRPLVRVGREGALSQVIDLDRFGNVVLALRFTDLMPWSVHFLVEVVGKDLPGCRARVVRCYSDLSPGELGAYCDAWGHVSLAVHSGNAADLLSVGRGMLVRLSHLQAPSDREGLREHAGAGPAAA